MDDKEKIISIFNANVRNKKADVSGSNARHDGKAGHWLERMMGIKANASNAPDLLGYEMKNETASKTTFGDWSADYYIFKQHESVPTRDIFLQIFGKSNADKKGRFSWSGAPIPKIDIINSFGQTLIIDAENNIIIQYYYSKDKRPDKNRIIPRSLRVDGLTIARWDAASIKKKLEKKFNNRGWFKCRTNSDGIYTSIVFGDPITFEVWIKHVKSGDVFFDSGMYQGNKRNYSQWRANNSFWEKLITSSF